jgi:hypothetical protein
LRQQNCLDEGVQPIQIDVRQDRGDHPALRRAAERGVPDPVLQVSGLKHVAQQPQDPVVEDLLAQRVEHDRMLEPVEALCDVALDEPRRPSPGHRHLAERGVAAPAGTETGERSEKRGS